MTCPDCIGDKVEFGLACPNMRLVRLPCSTCKGTGEVDAAFLARRALGAQIRSARTTRDLSLREAAKRLDVSTVALSDAERGLSDPVALLEMVRAL